MKALRAEYEKKDDTPLAVKFVGDMCRENVGEVIPALLKLNFSAKPFSHQDRFKVDKGPAKLSVYVTRAIHANWFYVNDRVGWVDRDPIERITDAIEKRRKSCRDIESARAWITFDSLLSRIEE